MIIDAHLHVWDPSTARYDWLGPEHHPIDRTVEFDEVRPHLVRAGVDGCVLVQSADHADDTAGMLAVAAREPAVLGVVAWLPLDDPDAAAARLAELRRDSPAVGGPRVVGVRSLIHDRADPDWIIGERADRGLGVLEAAGVPFDYVTADPVALRHLPTIAERHPRLALVLDHLGKPPIGGDAAALRAWRDALATAAANPRLVAKVSGLYASVGAQGSWTREQLRAVVLDAVELFGPDRLMFGGDWPMSVLAGGYDRVWDALSSILDELAPAERDAVLGGTATRVYGLDPASAAPPPE